MLNRIILLVCVMSFVYVCMRYLKKRQENTVKAATSQHSAHTTTPTILYFWSPQCQHCKTTQKPILEKLQEKKQAALALRMININDKPDEAANWGVRTVPTTYVLDSLGNLVHINNGVATEKQLLNQLDSVLQST